MVQSDMKLAIRSDRESGLVRAYFSTLDDSGRVEVATISIRLLDETPGLFDRWKEALRFALVATTERATGLEVVFCDEIKRHNLN